MNELRYMLLVSYMQQYFDNSITVLTNQVWKLLIALFKVPEYCCSYGTVQKQKDIVKRTQLWYIHSVNVCVFGKNILLLTNDSDINMLLH